MVTEQSLPLFCRWEIEKLTLPGGEAKEGEGCLLPRALGHGGPESLPGSGAGTWGAWAGPAGKVEAAQGSTLSTEGPPTQCQGPCHDPVV